MDIEKFRRIILRELDDMMEKVDSYREKAELYSNKTGEFRLGQVEAHKKDFDLIKDLYDTIQNKKLHEKEEDDFLGKNQVKRREEVKRVEEVNSDNSITVV